MRPVRGPISPRAPPISAASAGSNQPSSESNAANFPESTRSAPSLRSDNSEYASSTGAWRGRGVRVEPCAGQPPAACRGVTVEPFEGQRDLDDLLRQVPPEAHSAVSRDDALGPTDGVRLLVPYIVSSRLYRDPSPSQHHCLYQRAMMGIKTSAPEPQIATSNLFCD